ncbi:MAG: flagellar basal-body MS-ring/collar protein FliF [Candidatus Sericytochromatia bacterium]|nr:flagellar basal-body MS-ring/collar protein FliF [Candidatus Sericytochromatia bacterium]
MNFFAELPGQAKALIGVLATLVVVLAGVAFIPRGGGAEAASTAAGPAPGYVVLFSNLEPRVAGDAGKVLQTAQLPFRITKDGTSLEVPAERADEARVKLAAEGIPKEGDLGFTQIFGEKLSSLVATDFEKRVAFNRALNGELSRIIRKIDGIQAASVIVNMPEERLFTEERKPTTASVMLKQDPAKRLAKQQVEGIQHLVASSVPGLKTNNVTVVSDTGSLLSDGMTENAGDVQDRLVAKALDRQLMLTHEREAAIESKVQSLLDKIFGPGKSVVRVAVDLDFTQKRTKTRLFAPPADGSGRSAPSSTQKVTERTTGGKAGGTSGGVPGTSSNLPRVPGYPLEEVPSGGATGSQYERTAESTQHGTYSMNDTLTEEEVGTVKRLSVTALIQGLPAERVPAMMQIVASTSGADVGGRGDQIVVQPVAFDTSQTDMLKQLLEQQDETKKAKGPKKKEGGIPLSWIIGVAAAFLALLLLIAVFRLSNRKEDTTDVLVDSLGDTGMPSNFDPNALGAYGPTEMTGQVPGAGEEGLFFFLEQADRESVAELLSRERPATAAGILAMMNPGNAEDVLAVMPPELQEQIFAKLQEGSQLPAFQARTIATKLRRDLGVPA